MDIIARARRGHVLGVHACLDVTGGTRFDTCAFPPAAPTPDVLCCRPFFPAITPLFGKVSNLD